MNSNITDLFDSKNSKTDNFVLLPVIEEAVEITSEIVETGVVRVRIVVDEVTDVIQASQIDSAVSTVSVPRGIQVDNVRAPWHEGDVLVIPVYEEVTVTERRIILKEEIHVRRYVSPTTREVEVVLRKERAVVERQLPDGSWAADVSASRMPSSAV